MSDLARTLRESWQPVTTGDTSSSRYWLNWRVLLCVIWVLISMIFASYLISKYEGPRNSKRSTANNNNNNVSHNVIISSRISNQRRRSEEDDEEENPGILYEDEVWMPCLKGIHTEIKLYAFKQT